MAKGDKKNIERKAEKLAGNSSETPEGKLDALRKLIQNEAMFEIVPSLAGIDPEAIKEPGGSIYYGTGLCTPKELSVGLPFDTLGMVLVAERLRRLLGMERIIHFVADTHAKSNRLFGEEAIDELGRKTRKTLELMAKNLGLENFEVLFASEFDQTQEYLKILEFVQPRSDKHEYVEREVADIEWLRIQRGLKMKVGWIIQATETVLGSDERVFDREYKSIFPGGKISFLYTKAGRTLDRKRPKASPYVCIPKEQRILLVPEEKVREKLAEAEKAMNGDKSLGGAKNHLMAIVRLYERLFGSLGNQPYEEKVQLIIAKVTVGL